MPSVNNSSTITTDANDGVERATFNCSTNTLRGDHESAQGQKYRTMGQIDKYLKSPNLIKEDVKETLDIFKNKTMEQTDEYLKSTDLIKQNVKENLMQAIKNLRWKEVRRTHPDLFDLPECEITLCHKIATILLMLTLKNKTMVQIDEYLKNPNIFKKSVNEARLWIELDKALPPEEYENDYRKKVAIKLWAMVVENKTMKQMDEYLNSPNMIKKYIEEARHLVKHDEERLLAKSD